MKTTKSFTPKHLILIAVLVSALVWEPVMQPASAATTPLTQPAPSTAAVNLADTTIAGFAIRSQTGLPTQIDAAKVETAIAGLFANMQETGVNVAIQQQILANPQDFVNNGVLPTQVAAQYDALVKSKIIPANANQKSQFTSAVVATSSAQRAAFIARVRLKGLANVEQEYLTNFSAASERLPNGPSHIVVTPSAYGFGQVKPRVLSIDYASALDSSPTHAQRIGNVCDAMAAFFSLAALMIPALAIIAFIYAMMSAFGVCD